MVDDRTEPRPVRRVRGIGARRRIRRGFNLAELLISLAISSALLTAVMAALDASFMAYQSTTEQASTNTIGRLTMARVLSLVRSGEEFGPFPANPLETVIESDLLEIRMPDSDDVITIEWRSDEEALYYIVGEAENLLLEGVIEQIDPETGDPVPPFTLEFDRGRTLERVTIDLAVEPDDNMSVELDGDYSRILRLVASAQPRNVTFD